MATKTTKKPSSRRGTKPAPNPTPAPIPAAYLPYVFAGVGVALVLLGVFSLLACFQKDAILLNWLDLLESGLVGYTQMLVPFALAAVGGEVLARKHLQRLPLKIVCTLLFPIWLSAIFHTFTQGDSLQGDFFAAVASLWLSGQALTSGGVLGGLVASALVKLVGRVGSVILLLLALFLTLVGLFGLSTLLGLIPPPAERAAKAAARKERSEARKAERSARAAEREKKASEVDAPSVLRTPDSEDDEAEEPSLLRRVLPFLRRSSAPDAPEETAAPEEPPLAQDEDRGLPFAPQILEPNTSTPSNDGDTGLPFDESAPQPARAKRTRAKRRAAETAEPEETSPAQGGRSTGETVVLPPKKVADEDVYRRPGIDLLDAPLNPPGRSSEGELNQTQNQLAEAIRSYGIDAEIIGRTHGPTVTRFEASLAQGVRLSSITNLSNDIALNLGATRVRIAPIPGQRSVVGIEVPNLQVSPVYLRSVLDGAEFKKHTSRTAFALGRDIGNQDVIGDISRLPHVLIAGTTGSGKSVCVNSMLISLLYKSSPKDVRLIMIDPKMVELSVYNGIPHLLIPVVTDPKKAAGALQWAVYEMMRRYKAFAEQSVRDMSSYNAFAATRDGREAGVEPMPSIVVVIDELADLMLAARKEVEDSICRVAQMGRAAGMHLVIATQRPSKDVITGLMKANIPSRIAFAVASAIDSRIILDQSGAEKLVGKGDMLFAPLGIDKPMRVQGCLVTDAEVSEVVGFIKKNSTANYDESVLAEVEENAKNTGKGGKGASALNVTFPEPEPAPETEEATLDELFAPAVDVILETGSASVSMLQRRLKLGYSRAARLVDQMEEQGIVGPFEGSKPRKVLVTREQWQEMKARGSFGADEFALARSMSAASDAEDGFAPDTDAALDLEDEE